VVATLRSSEPGMNSLDRYRKLTLDQPISRREPHAAEATFTARALPISPRALLILPLRVGEHSSDIATADTVRGSVARRRTRAALRA